MLVDGGNAKTFDVDGGGVGDAFIPEIQPHQKRRRPCFQDAGGGKTLDFEGQGEIAAFFQFSQVQLERASGYGYLPAVGKVALFLAAGHLGIAQNRGGDVPDDHVLARSLEEKLGIAEIGEKLSGIRYEERLVRLVPEHHLVLGAETVRTAQSGLKEVEADATFGDAGSRRALDGVILRVIGYLASGRVLGIGFFQKDRVERVPDEGVLPLDVASILEGKRARPGRRIQCDFRLDGEIESDDGGEASLVRDVRPGAPVVLPVLQIRCRTASGVPPFLVES